MESELVMGCVVAGGGFMCGGNRMDWRVCMHLERIITNFKFKSKVVKVSPTEVVEINGYELFITLKINYCGQVICTMLVHIMRKK